MAKYFLFMYVEDSWLTRFFNLAIYVMNPNERWPAHVTLAGPFKDKRSVPRSLKFNQQISTLGAGQFRSETQNTVFLHVGSPEMAAHLNKPDFGRAIPHLTLYNGLNNDLGDKFYQELREIRAYTYFYTTSLFIVESRQQLDFDFKLSIDLSLIPQTKGMILEDIKFLSDSERIKIAISAVQEGINLKYYK